MLIKLIFSFFFLLSFFFGGTEKPLLYMETPSESFWLSAPSGRSNRDWKIFLEQNKTPAEMVVTLSSIRSTSIGNAHLQIKVNGILFCKFDSADQNEVTFRIPRLFWRPGQNTLTLELGPTLTNRTPVQVSYQPLIFSSHLFSDSPFSSAHSVFPEPEILCEPVYDLAGGTIRIWLSLLGSGMDTIERAIVLAELGKIQKQLPYVTFPGKTGFEAISKGRFETLFSLNELTEGVNPVKITIFAPGYSQKTIYLPLRKPVSLGKNESRYLGGSDNKNLRHTVRIPFSFYPENVNTSKWFPESFSSNVKTKGELSFDVFHTSNFSLVSNDLIFPKTTYDFQDVSLWIKKLHDLGALVFASRENSELTNRFMSYLSMLDLDGLDVYDGKWDSLGKIGGIWDAFLGSRKRMAVYASKGYNGLAGNKNKDNLFLESMRRGPHWVSDSEFPIEISLAGVGAGETASLVVRNDYELRIKVSLSNSFPSNSGVSTNVTSLSNTNKAQEKSNVGVALIDEIFLISERGGLPGKIIRGWKIGKAKADLRYNFNAKSPNYFRVVATGKQGQYSISAPIFTDIRPDFPSKIVLSRGKVEAPTNTELLTNQTYENGSLLQEFPKTFPILLGNAYCREWTFPFSPPKEGVYQLELGLSPTPNNKQPKILTVQFGGRTIGTYRSEPNTAELPSNTLIPFRVSLGKLEVNKSRLIRVYSDSPNKGIAVCYLKIIHCDMPFSVLSDVYAEGGQKDILSEHLHRHFAYNAISTLPQSSITYSELESALYSNRDNPDKDRSENAMFLSLGTHGVDTFLGANTALAFSTLSTNEFHPSYSKAGSLIPALDLFGGVHVLGQPIIDPLFSWISKNEPPLDLRVPTPNSGDSPHYLDACFPIITHLEWLNTFSSNKNQNLLNLDQPLYLSRMEWEQSRFVRGERSSPLFLMASSHAGTRDTKMRKNQKPFFYAGTYVESPGIDLASIKSSISAGNMVVSSSADVRLIVFLENAAGQCFQPGNRVTGNGPYRIHLNAWAPRTITQIKLVGPRGLIEQRNVSGNDIEASFFLPQMSAWDWCQVEVRGVDGNTTAIANPFLRY